jgi:hypothetical protein
MKKWLLNQRLLTAKSGGMKNCVGHCRNLMSGIDGLRKPCGQRIYSKILMQVFSVPNRFCHSKEKLAAF